MRFGGAPYFNFKKMKNLIFSLILITLVNCSGGHKEEKFELLWDFSYSKPADGGSLITASPTLTNQGLLIAPDEQFSMLSTESGDLLWQFEFPSNQFIIVNEYLIDGEKLFAKEDKLNELFNIDLKTGDTIWKEKSETRKFFQHTNDGQDQEYLYIIGYDYEVFRYTKSGIFDKRYDIANYSIDTDARSLRVLNNQLIFSQRFRGDQCPSRTCGRILSIDKETEEVLWEYRTENGGFIFEPILLEDEIIYAGVTDGPGEFVALNANNGEVIWKTLGIIGQSYTLTDSMVLVNGGVSLYALDKFTGKELWNTGLAFGGGHGQSNIAYMNGFVYHAHSGRLYVLDGTNGEIVHTEERSPDGSPFYLLTVNESKVFVQSFYALYAYTAWE